jgi:hypothetical protein
MSNAGAAFSLTELLDAAPLPIAWTSRRPRIKIGPPATARGSGVLPLANHSVLGLCVAVQGTKRREIYGEKLREEEEEARGGRRKKRAAMAMGAEKSGGTNLVEGKEGILRMRGRGCARGEAGSVGGRRRHVWVGRK